MDLQYKSTPPVATDGDNVRAQADASGNLKVALQAGSAALGSVIVTGGQTASGATPTGNPMMTALVGRSTNQPAVSNGQVVRPQGTLNGTPITKPYGVPELDWQYAAASGGITNTTTAVPIKAAHATERNYVTAIQIMSDALGAATELAIRDGAGGTVIWRTKIPTTGFINGLSIQFPTPLKGTAATLLEVVTLTASVTGSVYFNAQGYTAP